MGATRIDLSWTAPADDGGHEITGYRIEWSPDGTSDWTVLKADTDNTDTTYSHEGLSSKTTRHYRVSAINTLGAGAASDVASATTDDIEGPAPVSAEVPSQGQTVEITFDEVYVDHQLQDWLTITADGVPVGYTGVSNTDRGTPKLVLGWFDPPVRAGQVVRVTYTDPTAGDDTAGLGDVHGNDAPSFSLGPDPDMGDLFAVTNNSGVQPTVPDAPTRLETAAASLTSIALGWWRPEDNGGRVITGYRIEYCDDVVRPGDGRPGRTWRPTRTARTPSVHGLGPGARHHPHLPGLGHQRDRHGGAVRYRGRHDGRTRGPGHDHGGPPARRRGRDRDLDGDRGHHQGRGAAVGPGPRKRPSWCCPRQAERRRRRMASTTESIQNRVQLRQHRLQPPNGGRRAALRREQEHRDRDPGRRRDRDRRRVRSGRGPVRGSGLVPDRHRPTSRSGSRTARSGAWR